MRRAASIVLLRRKHGASDFEVLMAQRSKALKAFGGAYVFPGGVVERCDGPEGSVDQLKQCGLRELFEEVGLLLSGQGAATPVHFASVEERIQWQTRVKNNPEEFAVLLKEKQVVLPHLFHLVHFTTPVMEPKRFATDFFVLDSGKFEGDLEFHESETTSLLWITPQEAIARNRSGTFPFLPPQYFVLQMLQELGKTPEDIVLALSSRSFLDEPVPILPHALSADKERITLCYPGDESHPDFPLPGHRHRIHVKLPMGNGFDMESTLNHRFLSQGQWQQKPKL